MNKSYIKKSFQMRIISRILKRSLSVVVVKNLIIHAMKNALGKSPTCALIGITYSCNAKCSYCSSWNYRKEQSKELNIGQWKDVISQISGMNPIYCQITGGEPLLKEEVYNIAGLLNRKGILTILETNGYMLDEKAAKNLKDSGISLVCISIDSCKSKKHDLEKNLNGSYRKAINAAKACLSNGIPCMFSFLVTKKAIRFGEVKSICQLAKAMEMDGVRLNPVIPSGRAVELEESKIGLTEEEKKELMNQIDVSIAFYDGIYKRDGCRVLKKDVFYVSPYGEIQPCNHVPLFFGDLKKEKLKPSLNHMWNTFRNFRKSECLLLEEDLKEFIKKNRIKKIR